MLVAERLSIRFGQNTIIHDMQLDLSSKQCIGLLGANGAGKSTLLRAISQEIVYQGCISWQGKNLADYSTLALARVMGFLPQQNYLGFAFTAEEVVLLGRMMHDTSNKENLRIVAHIMAQFDITHLSVKNYLQLSGGEKQRVHAARVWAQLYETEEKIAKILLLDEPTSALDLKHQHLLMAQAKEYAVDNNIVIVTVHDLNLAARYCDHLLLLHEGKLLVQGTATEVLTPEYIKIVYGYNAKVVRQDDGLMIW